MDGRDLHLDVTENPYEYRCFNITKIPVMVSFKKNPFLIDLLLK